MKRILLRKNHQILSVLLDDAGQSLEIGCYDESDAVGLGNILICRVKDVAENIKAAFVDIGMEENAYLPFADLGDHTVFTKKNGKKLIAAGDEILVQIAREPIKTKPPAVTTKLSISGKLVAVVADGKRGVNFSKKITDFEFKKRVKAIFLEPLDERFSIIIRTNAASVNEAQTLAEAKKLQGIMSDILSRAPYQICLTRLYEGFPDWLAELRDTRDEGLSEVVTDDEEIYSQISAGKEHVLGEKTALRLYNDPGFPLIKAYSIERLLREALAQRVWLKSGGYLIIQPTEALVVIDVNSGKSEYKGKNHEAAYKLNLEAAKEAARQIRLRNLSGIILIDFINMDDEKMKQELLKTLGIYLNRDRIKTTLMGMTRLELTEITRKKTRKPLYQTGVSDFLAFS